jgi:hypothetical protein
MANVILQILDIRLCTVKKFCGATFYTFSDIRQGEFAFLAKNLENWNARTKKNKWILNTRNMSCVIELQDMELA